MIGRLSLTLLAICALFAIACGSAVGAPRQDSPPDGTPCTIDARGGGFGGNQGVYTDGVCGRAHSGGSSAHGGPPTKAISCGILRGPGVGSWNPDCGAKTRNCFTDEPGQTREQVSPFATVTFIGEAWRNPQVWCPGNVQPAVTMDAIREQALRLLPHVAIGSAWTDTALVNAEVVLWADTDTTRDLPTATVVGQQVALRIDHPQARWTYGDGQTQTTTDLGKPYDRTGDPCRTAQCSDYYGHTYRHTGHPRITLQIGWNVHYRIGTGNWTDLPGDPLTGPASTHDLTVRAARGILIDTPH